MKLLLLLSAIFLLTISADKCGKKKKTETGMYKAKLEIKALCMNYTLQLLEGNIDTSLITAKWIDESTGKSYTNVFALGNPCIFPATLNQGDEFYFLIDTSIQKDCIICLAWYPKPAKALSIKVIDK